MGVSQRRVRPALRTGAGSVLKRWRRPVRKVERIGGRFCLARDGPEGAEGADDTDGPILGADSSGHCTRNRALGIGVARGFGILRVVADISGGWECADN
jgi:hypothetical protein